MGVLTRQQMKPRAKDGTQKCGSNPLAHDIGHHYRGRAVAEVYSLDNIARDRLGVLLKRMQ